MKIEVELEALVFVVVFDELADGEDLGAELGEGY